MPDAAPVTTATRPVRSKARQRLGVHAGALPWIDCRDAPRRGEQGVAEAGDLLARQLLGQPHDGERQRHRAVGPEHRRRDLAEAVGGALLELLEEVLLVGEVLHRHRQGPASAVAARQGPAQLQVGDGLEVERVATSPDDRQRRRAAGPCRPAWRRGPTGPATPRPRRARPRPGRPSPGAGPGGRAGPR